MASGMAFVRFLECAWPWWDDERMVILTCLIIHKPLVLSMKNNLLCYTNYLLSVKNEVLSYQAEVLSIAIFVLFYENVLLCD
jgi:hypothetical protein